MDMYVYPFGNPGQPTVWRSAVCFRPATRRGSGSQHRRLSIRCAGDRPWRHPNRLQMI